MDELIGRAVTLHSLMSRADLNGRHGSVISYDGSKQRYGVCVDGEAKAMSLKPSCLLYGPVFEDDPGLVLTFNAEHLVGHALRGQVRCVERILDNGVDVNACCPGILWAPQSQVIRPWTSRASFGSCLTTTTGKSAAARLSTKGACYVVMLLRWKRLCGCY